MKWLGATLVLVGALVVASNWFIIIRFAARRIHGSVTPFLGGALMAGGIWLIPEVRSLWWIPLLIDYGAVPMLVAACVGYVRRRLKEG
jgi:hypothetical protein